MATSQQLRRQIKELLSAGTLTAGDGTVVGGATALKQDEIISLLAQLIDRSAESAPLTPSLQIATTSGTIPTGAKFISIAIAEGTTGTIMGETIRPDIASIELPYIPVGYTIRNKLNL